MTNRDGHIRVLPLHVANKIAAGEVVERPASVVKELVENAIDAGARQVRISIVQGGRKLVAVQDDGCGMSRDDAVLSLERQATSKILDVDDIEEIDTLGFRGEAIPSIASVSRFSLTTRRADTDEGTNILVNAGTLAEIRTAGCPPGTLVEVRDLFCNVPARRKFLRAYVTEENHVKSVFTTHALAHPGVGFSLTMDGREIYRLAPVLSLNDRVRDLFGEAFLEQMAVVRPQDASSDPRRTYVRVSGFIERPNPATPTRREQYVFVNGRPATAPAIAYALREAYPRHPGDTRPAAILLLELPANQVDVNVHPTKREVRFRDTTAVREAVMASVGAALTWTHPTCVPAVDPKASTNATLSPFAPSPDTRQTTNTISPSPVVTSAVQAAGAPTATNEPSPSTMAPERSAVQTSPATTFTIASAPMTDTPAPVAVDLPFASADGQRAQPWNWFHFLALTQSGFLLIETDAGMVTVNPRAARERIAFEKLMNAPQDGDEGLGMSQPLLIPETLQLSPPDFARIAESLSVIRAMGFQLEAFGHDTYKIDAVPQLIGTLPPQGILQTIANDLAESAGKRGSSRWREDLIAKSIARSYAGSAAQLTEEGAVQLINELSATRMPYVCPRGKPVMIFTSNNELNRKFCRR